jgi:uncharacterized damage-inducible protein DinB
MSTLLSAGFDRPAADEHLPYYGRYIDLVPAGDLVAFLEAQEREFPAFLASIPSEKHEHRYGEGKWSVKEVIGHLNDSERLFVNRVLRFARQDQTPVPGYDENTYVPAGNFDARSMESLAEEWQSVRRATMTLLRSLDADAGTRRGTANGAEISVRALTWVMAGHVIHHTNILRERYLGQSRRGGADLSS